MHLTHYSWFLLLHPALAQRIFINQVAGYSSLPQCAEKPLSTIVRNMESGCGDQGKTTSYSCFCTASSTAFSNIISSAVSLQCSNSQNYVTSALDVFSAYCQIGKGASSVPASISATSTSIASSTSTAAISTLQPIPSSASNATERPQETFFWMCLWVGFGFLGILVLI